MIEILRGTLEERIIKILQQTYPITVSDLVEEMHISDSLAMRELKKLQVKGIIQLESLPDKTFMRLIRNDISFIGKKRQRKFIKHDANNKNQKTEEYDGIMYS